MDTSFTTFLRRSLWALVLSAPAWSQTPGPPRPGSINYVEGQASIGISALAPGAVGSVVLEKDQLLTTQAGKVEVLLTPGVFLRVTENSSVKMVAPDLENTRVELQKGRALVEVIQIHKENDLRIDQNGASTRILKIGLYDFDADHAQVRVFKGSAEVTAADQNVKLTENREIALNASVKPRSQNFDPKMSQDDFYRWTSLRSGYLSEASVSAARTYMGAGVGLYGAGWVGFGWYWDPMFGVYTFLPAEGIFMGPFGWGFYSPFAVYASPFFF
jgi:FecR-like protein